MPVLFAVLKLLFGWPVCAGKSSLTGQVMDSNDMANEDVMSEDRFWTLIDHTSAYEADPQCQLEALRQVLRDLTVFEIEAFERAFQREKKRAYIWDLWGAAFLMNGGASDDGFEYFQLWLISKGRRVFDAAVGNPDSLADMAAPSAPGTYEFEEFAYVASNVWAEKTGINPWKDAKGSFPSTGAPPASQPAGTAFEESKSFLANKYPKLWARFGSSWL